MTIPTAGYLQERGIPDNLLKDVPNNSVVQAHRVWYKRFKPLTWGIMPATFCVANTAVLDVELKTVGQYEL